jgi:predicted O-linked N-acetylglucosamine transferase (SPINDLY family)
MSFADSFRMAANLLRLGRLQDAEAVCRHVLSQAPSDSEALLNLGVVLQMQERHEEAIATYNRAIGVEPNLPRAFCNRGNALLALGRKEEALASLNQAIGLDPDYAWAFVNRALTFRDLGRRDEALADAGRATALAPDLAEAHYVEGNVLLDMKKPQEAVACYDRALALRPGHAKTLTNQALALHALRREEAALSSADEAVLCDPGFGEAHAARGDALFPLGRAQEAIAAYSRALSLQPDNVPALISRGTVLLCLGRLEDALADHNRAIAVKPDFAFAYFSRSWVFYALDRKEEAWADTEKALLLEPGFDQAAVARWELASHFCDWREDRTKVLAAAREAAEQGLAINPFIMLGLCDDPVLQLQSARNIAMAPKPAIAGPHSQHERLRIAYISGDFRDHAVAHQAVALFERHDRARFDTYGICIQRPPVADSAIRERLKGAFGHFVEAGHRSDLEVARLLCDLGIDIAVDLGGYTDKARPEILSWRPAPVTVTYLGYPGTLGTDYVDYIVADATVIPPENDVFFTEKIVRLPGCFMPTDSKTLAATVPTRAQVGLPESGFVFCAFNKSNKLTPEIFDIWMRLLSEVADSVLWLNVDDHTARNNLRTEAEARHVSPRRLIFADRTPDRERHLARLALADLFLDTLPYNAHATANDMLRANVPVLTCMGRSIAARVAGSMLLTMGAEESIATDLVQYEAIALKLARTPRLLADLRAKLAASRALFDTEGLTRHLEIAYEKMWELHIQGRKPESFSV